MHNDAANQSRLNGKADYLFRISIKGLVRNENNRVLVVKEARRTHWDLPGGGMDHGESIKQAIQREFNEEVSLAGDFTYRILGVEEPSLLERTKVWQIRLIFEIIPTNRQFSPGKDGDEILFINPENLKNSESLVERKVYEYSQLALGLVAPK